MKRDHRIKLLLVIAVIWVMGIFVVQLYTLPQIREQVASGLHSGLQEIARQLAQQLSQAYEQQLKSELTALSHSLSSVPNASKAESQWNKALSKAVLADAWALALPDSATQTWRVQEYKAPASWLNQTPLTRLVAQKLPLAYDHWEEQTSYFWSSRIDSALLLSEQTILFNTPTQVACWPRFDAGSNQLIGLVCMQIDAAQVQTEFIPQYFRSFLSAEDEKRKDGIRKGFLQIRVRDERGDAIYQSSLLVSGAIEARVPIRLISPYLGAYQVEVGFLGKDSQGVADSLHQRNVWMVLGVFGVLLLLLGLIYLTNRRAQRLAQLKSDFLANISHELKTPLAAIRLANDTLRLGRSQTSEQTARSNEIIHLEAQRLERLLVTLLDFSQLEAGKRNFHLRRLDLTDWWNHWLPYVQEKMQLQGFSLQIEGEAPFAAIQADPEALEAVLDILLDNAWKYSGSSREICLHTHTHAQEWEIAVEDFGIGIPARQQAVIFEKFVRLGDPEIHDVKGYGIGLSIAKAIMEAHQGRMEVSSTPGKGSRFSLYFPLLT